MKYEAVIFDLFGTLVDKFSLHDHTGMLSQMASVLSIPADDFVKLWFDTFDMRGLGEFKSLEENIDYICRQLGVPPENDRVRLVAKMNIDYTARSMIARPQAIEVLSRLKSQGYRTGLITNCSAEIPKIWPSTSFAPLIDVTTFSASAGVQKPDPRIYQLAAEQLEVKPEKCLYIGDGDSQELTGAATVGMNPVLIRAPDEDKTDVHRVNYEANEWVGMTINSLEEILTLL